MRSEKEVWVSTTLLALAEKVGEQENQLETLVGPSAKLIEHKMLWIKI